MKDFVSGINPVLASAVLMIVAGILVADLPWSAFIFVSGAAALALWRAPRLRAVAPARVVSPAPKATQ